MMGIKNEGQMFYHCNERPTLSLLPLLLLPLLLLPLSLLPLC